MLRANYKQKQVIMIDFPSYKLTSNLITQWIKNGVKKAFCLMSRANYKQKQVISVDFSKL